MLEGGMIMDRSGRSRPRCPFVAIRVRDMIFWRIPLDGTKWLTI